MTKKELVDRLSQMGGNKVFLSSAKTQRLLGISWPTFKKLMEGYTPVHGGGSIQKKNYFIDDIADAVMKKGL